MQIRPMFNSIFVIKDHLTSLNRKETVENKHQSIAFVKSSNINDCYLLRHKQLQHNSKMTPFKIRVLKNELQVHALYIDKKGAHQLEHDYFIRNKG